MKAQYMPTFYSCRFRENDIIVILTVLPSAGRRSQTSTPSDRCCPSWENRKPGSYNLCVSVTRETILGKEP